MKEQAAFYPSIEELRLDRKRSNPTYSRMEYLDGYESSAEMYCHGDPSEHYRHMYFEVIDVFVMSLKERCDHESYNHYAKMENVLVAAINGEEVYEEGIEVLWNEYSDDLDIDSLIMGPLVVILLLVNPAANASAERSFSLSRRLKTWQ